METFEKALTLVTPGTKFGSVDLKHAYYSIKITEEQQKYFRLIFNGITYQYTCTCLANGVSVGLRLFAKLMQAVYTKLRNDQECTKNIQATSDLMTQVGFMINVEKSALIPTTRIIYLSNIVDSEKMLVELPEHRQEKLIQVCKDLFNKSIASIREVAMVIGLIVASLSAVDYGKLHYRQLESEKVQAWKTKKGNYNAIMPVSESMKKEISWWIKNVKSQLFIQMLHYKVMKQTCRILK